MRGGFIMRQMVKKFFVVMMLLLAFVCVMGDDNVSAKVKKKKIKLTTSKNNSDKAIYLSDKVKKIKVTYSKKGIITNGKIDRLGNFKYQVKKPGKTTVTVKAYTKRKKVCGIYKLMLTVKDTRKEDSRKEDREAFKIQNQYREKKGVSPLKWSDELYKFAEYRMETSGFDSHKNVQRDAKTFSGEKYMIFFRISTLGENLSTATNAVDSMPLWKNSPGHYNNLLNSRWKTGAIYSSSRGTIAVFSEFSKDEIDNWRTYEDWRIVITRKDSATGTLLSDCQFTIEKVSDGSLVCSVGISSSKTETSTRKLVPGETYKVYEVITPTGYKKAKPITFTVTEGTNYITMTD